MSEERAEAVKKKVDESWKDSVAKERSKNQPAASVEPPPEAGEAEATFEYFISSLGMQAITALNEGKIEQSRTLIDMMQMLAEKTQGNLTLEESQALQELLYQLQLQFVKKSQQAEG